MEPLAAGDPPAIGGFRLNARLGFGGMGRVYLGFSPAGRAVAVKVVRPELAMDAGFRHRFHTEVEAARRVSGAYTAPVIAAGPDDDPPWLATVFVPGPSLDDVVSAHGGLPAVAAWKLAAGLVEAVQAVHSCGVVHRDLKPGNVLLAEDGPRVIDFGIARALDGTSVTATRTVFGTVPFMSPEQAEGLDIGPASDVFALGSVIVYAATGSAPFGDGNPASVLYRIVHGRPSLAGVPSGLLEIVSACLVKEPAARPGLPALTEMIRSGSPGADLSATSFWPEPLLARIQTHKLALTTAPQAVVAATPPPSTPAPAQVPASQTGSHPATEISSSQTMTSWPAQLTPPPPPPPPSLPSPAPAWVPRPRRRLGGPHAVRWAAAAAGVIVVAIAATLVATSGGGKAPTAGQAPHNGTAAKAGAALTGAGYDAALTRVVNPSDHSGGTLTLAAAGLPDSFDPGNTYQTWIWDFSRLYATPLVTYRACPGSCGLQLVPGLATGLGQVSPDGLTWTYHLKRGVRFEDGTSVTAQDVKYAVERGYDKSVLPSGTYYFQNLLTDTGYSGPYQDRAKNLMGLSSVTTPDAYTIQFHLQSPFPDFDHIMALPATAPVPPAKDSGARYQQHPLSTGPYMFQTFTANQQLTLVPNPRWQPSYNPQVKQLPSKIVINLNVGSAAVDQQLLSGATDLDASGSGVQDTTQARVFASAALKANADNPLTGTVQFAYLNTQVSPLDNVACRRAVEYAADKTAVQTAFGGPVRGGPIASTVLPPVLPGYQKSDQFEATTMSSGDIAAAKRELAACGHPAGFTTGLAYENDQPAEVAAAQALRTSLARAGIKVQLSGYPSSSYYSTDAGVPAFVHAHDLGIDLGVWTADWPDGYGFLDTLTDGDTISSSYNANIEELNDPAVNGMFTRADGAPESAPARTAIWTQIDRQVMSDAAILPEVDGAALLYRNPALTNVYVDARYGTYDYAVLGLK
jgi:ABC-type transport system substrate-binding protein/serine/threonine protein kinase